MTFPINIDAPTNFTDRRYWHVLLHGYVIALCPSEETALKVATALMVQDRESANDAERQ